ncbi:MAG: transposase [Trichloromonas sp.]|jgi:REP element-mobilizing transposase RayT|nr:transposase [Trichloromonas sp.]
MPRTARIDIPGQLYHVVARGVERCAIFRDDSDRASFRDRLGSLLLETGSACFAWALMTNHVHLLLRPGPSGLAAFMRRLLTGHAIVFNRRHQRAGHLFQNRYHSILCDADPYLLALVRYIHLNPLKAGVIDSLSALDTYPWCGHAVLMGNGELAGQAVDELLALFADTAPAARSRYRGFIEQGLAERGDDAVTLSADRLRDRLKNPADDDGFDRRIFGGQAFVETVLPQAARSPRPRIDLAELIRRAANEFDVSIEDLRGGGRTPRLSAARALICHLAIAYLDIPGTRLADYFEQARSSITRSERRGKELLRAQPEWRKLWTDG